MSKYRETFDLSRYSSYRKLRVK